MISRLLFSETIIYCTAPDSYPSCPYEKNNPLVRSSELLQASRLGGLESWFFAWSYAIYVGIINMLQIILSHLWLWEWFCSFASFLLYAYRPSEIEYPGDRSGSFSHQQQQHFLAKFCRYYWFYTVHKNVTERCPLKKQTCEQNLLSEDAWAVQYKR